MTNLKYILKSWMVILKKTNSSVVSIIDKQHNIYTETLELLLGKTEEILITGYYSTSAEELQKILLLFPV